MWFWWMGSNANLRRIRDQSRKRIVGIMQVSVCLEAILVPEYLDSTGAE